MLVQSRLHMLPYIHQMNRVNSRNDDSTINIVVVIIIIIKTLDAKTCCTT